MSSVAAQVPPPELCGGRGFHCDCGAPKNYKFNACRSCAELERQRRQEVDGRGYYHPALVFLRSYGQANAYEIAGHVDVTWQAVYRFLHRAEKKGWVERAAEWSQNNSVTWRAVRRRGQEDS